MNYIIIALLIVITVIIFYSFTNVFKRVHTNDRLKLHKSKALVLNCMDFRLMDDLNRFLDKNGYENNYDDFILAGSSLGFNQTTYPEWKKTFLKHLELSIQLHNIKELVIIDHMDCGGYKKFYNKKKLEPDEERKLHHQNLNKMGAYIKQNFPNLKVNKYLMNLDGSVHIIQ